MCVYVSGTHHLASGQRTVAAKQEAQRHRFNRGGRPQDPVAASAASYILPMHHTPMFYEHPARR